VRKETSTTSPAGMTYAIEWGEDPDVVVRTEGTASVEGLHAMTMAVLDDPRFAPGMTAIFDHRRLDWSGMAAPELRRRVEDLERIEPRIRGCAAAVIAGSPATFGLQRMLQAYADANLSRTFSLNVFYSVEDAREWLRTVRPT